MIVNKILFSTTIIASIFLVALVQAQSLDLKPVYTSWQNLQTRFGQLRLFSDLSVVDGDTALIRLASDKIQIGSSTPDINKNILLSARHGDNPAAIGADIYCTTDGSQCFSTKEIVDLVNIIKNASSSLTCD